MIHVMELARSRRSFLLATALAACASAGVAGWIAVRLGGERTTLWVDDLATPLAAALACAACLRARARHGGRLRIFWTLLAGATACWTVAEVVWGVYALVLVHPVPSPSWADVGYLAAIPLAVAALLVHPAIGGGFARRARATLDGGVLAAALLFLSWTLVLGPLWRSSDLGTAAGLVTFAYPCGDLVLVFCVVLAIRGMTGAERLSLWCLLAALLAMALTDSAYTYLTAVAGYSSSRANPIDAGWIAAYLGIALAALAARRGAPSVPAARSYRPSLASLLAPLVAVLLALGVVAVQLGLGHRLDRAAWLMAVGLVALVLVRQGLVLVELLGPGSRGEGDLTERLADAAVGGLHVGRGVTAGSGR